MRICCSLSFRTVLLVLFLIYAFLGGVSIYYMLQWYIPDTSFVLQETSFYSGISGDKIGDHNKEKRQDKNHFNTSVEIWGKAAIGNYLWQHILGGTLQERLGGVWSYGFKHIHGINFHFRTGPGVIPKKVPENVENLILVLNGREDVKVEFAKHWLNYIENLPSLRHVAVVLLGNERCSNDWIKKSLVNAGGSIRVLFLVYDDPDVDNHYIYQWPLGVATYRGFPVIEPGFIPVTRPRRYLCNFMGTVYVNSSRETMLKIIQERLSNLCYVRVRNSWLPEETDESREEYMKILGDSDLTLNPVGKNTECYRIYEAMSLGSIPVVEDVMTDGHCVTGHNEPLRLLKKYKAPIEYISSLKHLPQVIEKYQRLPLDELVEKRKRILSWYIEFKESLKEHFVGVIRNKFS